MFVDKEFVWTSELNTEDSPWMFLMFLFPLFFETKTIVSEVVGYLPTAVETIFEKKTTQFPLKSLKTVVFPCFLQEIDEIDPLFSLLQSRLSCWEALRRWFG